MKSCPPLSASRLDWRLTWKRWLTWRRVLAAGVLVAAATAGCHHDRVARTDMWATGARQAVEAAVKEAQSSKDGYWAVLQLSDAAQVMARIDKSAASRLIAEAVRRADSIPDLTRVLTGARTMEGGLVRGQGRIDAFEVVGRNAARIDRERGVELLERAIDLAQNAPPVEGFDRSAVMATAASDIADIEPQAALRQVHRIRDASSQARVLVAAANAFARADPHLAQNTLERATRLLADAGKSAEADAARAQITAALARRFPKAAVALLQTVKRRDNRDWVLLQLVEASAERHPKQAMDYARMIQNPRAAAAAFTELASAHPRDAGGYLGLAVASVRQGLAQGHWRAPMLTIDDVSAVALTLAATSRKSEALSLVLLAARETRAKCPAGLVRARALVLLSGAASQANPAVARDLLEEALKGVNPDTIGVDLRLDLAAGPLAILDPGLAEICVRRVPRESKAVTLFEMAKYAAGTRPALARKWLAQGERLDKSRPSRDDGALSSRAIAEARLMAHPRYALQTAASLRDGQIRTMVYLDTARAFVDRPPRKVGPEDALGILAVVVGAMPEPTTARAG